MKEVKAVAAAPAKYAALTKDDCAEGETFTAAVTKVDAVAAEATEGVGEVLEEEEASRMATVNKLSVAGQVYI